jgi:hypothetical protein
MTMQQTEFQFPDEAGDIEIEIEKSKALPVDLDDELDLEIVDDTPESDRGRTPSEPPEEVTDDELKDYSDKVRKRIQHFSKGYHDERRAKEQAQREKDELERLAAKLYEDNKRLTSSVGQSQAAIYEQATRAVAGELASAKAAYKDAYEAGNSDALLEAQDRLTTARMREEQLKNIGNKALQQRSATVQPETVQQPQPVQQKVVPDQKAVDWAKENKWFGQPGKDEMTALALGYHTKLVGEGVNPNSDDYYERLNARMRAVFPEEFEDTQNETRQKRSSVVAPATRSTAPKKVRLTQTQVAIAKRLGVPLELYAKQVAEDMRKEKDNG